MSAFTFADLTWDGCVRVLRQYEEALDRGAKDSRRIRRWRSELQLEMRRRHGLWCENVEGKIEAKARTRAAA